MGRSDVSKMECTLSQITLTTVIGVEGKPTIDIDDTVTNS
jgi:hypothetical protein